MREHIYADNAATTRLDAEAFAAMKPWLLEHYGNASQPYSFAREPKKALRAARETIARCLNALPEEIYFTSGGTESDNWTVKGLAFSGPARKTVITSAFEHHALLHSCRTIEHHGYPVVYLQPNSAGRITPDILERSITDETLLVSVMFANNELGTIQPIRELGAIAHAHGALFHTDAVQAVGHVAIDVKALGVDLLSASAHKFNGPKGIGFLYVRQGVKLPPYIDGGAQEHGARAGTENIASIVGMAVALKNNVAALAANQAHLKSLEKTLLDAMDAHGIRYCRNGSDPILPGILSLSFEGQDGEAILHRMDLMGISISTGSACDSARTQISHVLQAIRLPQRLAEGTVRISFGKYNTVDDAAAIAAALKKILL